MKLLIVDDEMKIREGLKTSINWKSIGIDEVHTAANGLDAMEIYSMSRHEIVITDVRMPGMDGLELSENIKKLQCNTHIIIISGFSEFEYAKKAMKLGVTDYELKPVDITGLMKLVASACERILKEREAEEVEKKHQALYMHDLFERLLDGDTIEGEILTGLHTLGFETNDYVMCILMEIDNFSNVKGADALLDSLSYGLKSLICRVLGEEKTLVYKKTDSSYVMIFKVKSDLIDSRHQRGIERLQKSIEEMFEHENIRISLGVSNPGRMGRLPVLYTQSLQSLKHKLYKGTGSLTFFKDIAGLKEDAYVNVFNEAGMRECIQRFDYHTAETILDSEFNRLKSERCTNSDFVRNMCIVMKNLLIRTVKDMNIDFYNLFYENIQLIEYVPWCETIEDYAKWVTNTYYIVLNGLSDIQNVKHNKLMLKAVEYIKINYYKDITIQEMADYIQKTPNYFCHLFKKEFGTSFSEYVNRVRINEAKNLMQNTNMLIYEVSEKVGFRDYDYFKQVFKKLEGFPPSELRKSGTVEK